MAKKLAGQTAFQARESVRFAYWLWGAYHLRLPQVGHIEHGPFSNVAAARRRLVAKIRVATENSSSGIIGIPCICCGEFKFALNRAAYYRANVAHLAFLCRACRALSAAQITARVQQTGLCDISDLHAAIEDEYMRVHHTREDLRCSL